MAKPRALITKAAAAFGRVHLPFPAAGSLLLIVVAVYAVGSVLSLAENNSKNSLVPHWLPAVSGMLAAALLVVRVIRSKTRRSGRTTGGTEGTTSLSAAASMVLAVAFLVGGLSRLVTLPDTLGWAVAALPVLLGLGVTALPVILRRLGRVSTPVDPGAVILEGPILQGSGRKELLDSTFHGFVNLLVELVALVSAFIFYLATAASSSVQGPIVDAVYNSRRVQLSVATQRAITSGCNAGQRAIEGAVDNAGGDSGVVNAVIGVAVAAGDGDFSCCASGQAAAQSAAAEAVIKSSTDPKPAAAPAAVNNAWVYRTSVLFLAMGAVAFVVAYAVMRMAGGPRANLAHIIRYNVVLLLLAIAVQVGFMVNVTLQYIPIEPSVMWTQMRDSLNRELDRAAAYSTTPLADSQGACRSSLSDVGSRAEAIFPGTSYLANALIAALVIASAASIWFAYRVRAFQRVSFLQGLCAQLLVVGIVMSTVYFSLNGPTAEHVQGRSTDMLARRVAGTLRGAPPEVIEAVRAELAGNLGEEQKSQAERQDMAAAEKNAEVLNKFAMIAVPSVLLLLGVLFLSSGGKNLRDPGYWKALAACALVAGSTSFLVEYGFLTNVFRHFLPLDDAAVFNCVAEAVGRSATKQSTWYCENGCDSVGTAAQEASAAAENAEPVVVPLQGTSVTWKWADGENDPECLQRWAVKGEEGTVYSGPVTDPSTGQLWCGLAPKWVCCTYGPTACCHYDGTCGNTGMWGKVDI